MKRWLITIVFLVMALAADTQKSTQVKELENQRKAIEKEIETTSLLLKQTKETAQRSLARLNLLTKQIEQRRQMIQLLTKEIAAADREMKGVEKEISILEKELDRKRDKYTMSLRMIQKHNNAQDKLLFIFSSTSFEQSVRRIRYLKEYAAWQKQQAYDITKKHKEIKTKGEELEKTRTEKQMLLATREKEYGKIEEEEATQRKEIEALDRKKTELQNELATKQRRAETLNRQIKEKIAEEVARAEAEAKASKDLAERTGAKTPEANKRQAETAGGYAMTKEEKQLSETFIEKRGQLQPVNQRYTVVSSYGVHQHPNLKYVRIENYGIDLQTTANAEAISVFSGTVRAVFVNEPGFSVIVRHGNYLTVYSNLRKVYVRKDQNIRTGEPIGLIHTDEENGNSTILHFELWKESNRQNPQPWLKL